MCIICAKEEGILLLDSVVQNMWDNNDDGAGFMYVEDGKLNVIKGLMTFDDFLKAYEPHKLKSLVMHFRIRTHGHTNAEMTHPFVVDENLAFAHNGIISGLGDSTHSDTWYFNELYLKKIREQVSNFLNIPPVVDLIADKIGHSKLVFMDNTGEITIVNEGKGERSKEGIWFSNSSWKTARTYGRSYSSSNSCGIPYGTEDYYEWYGQNKREQENTPTIITPQPVVTTKPAGSPAIPFWTDKNKEQDKKYQDNTMELLYTGDYARTSEEVMAVRYEVKDKLGNVIHNAEIKALPMGTACKVKAFNSDLSVDITNLEDRFDYRMRSCLFLDKLYNGGTLRKHWGHMKPQKFLEIVDFDEKFTRVIDPDLDRVYDIPTRLIAITTEKD